MSYQSELQTLRDLVRYFTLDEIPTETEWNVNPTVLHDLADKLATFLTQLSTADATMLSLFLVDHGVDGKNPVPVEWVPEAAVPSYLSATTFSLPNDRRADYALGHRIRCTINASRVVVAIASVGFAGGVTTITVDTAALTAQLTGIERGLVRYSAPKVTAADVLAKAIQNAALDDAIVGARVLAPFTVTPGHVAPGGTTPQVLAFTGADTPVFPGGTEILASFDVTPAVAGRTHIIVASAELETPLSSSAYNVGYVLTLNDSTAGGNLFTETANLALGPSPALKPRTPVKLPQYLRAGVSAVLHRYRLVLQNTGGVTITARVPRISVLELS